MGLTGTETLPDARCICSRVYPPPDANPAEVKPGCPVHDPSGEAKATLFDARRWWRSLCLRIVCVGNAEMAAQSAERLVKAGLLRDRSRDA